MDHPIILCGLGRIGSHVLEYLQTAGLAVVVIDSVCKPDDPRLKGTRLVPGDCSRPEILEAAGVATARGVLVLTHDDLLNVTTALNVRALNKDARVVLRMYNQNLLGRLGRAVHNVVAFSTSLLTAPALAATAVTGHELGSFRLEGLPGGRRDVARLEIGPGSPLRGRAVGSLTAGGTLAVLGHFHASGERHFLLDARPDARLAAGDELFLCGESGTLAPLLHDRRAADARGPRWADWPRRTIRLVRQALAEVDVSVQVCTAVLLLMLVVSTAVLHAGVYHDKIYLAFLRTVSIMATGSGLHEEDYPDSPGVMVFTSALRLVGAALVAAFTAIVTNYLIRARLRGVLEIRRIPESGHVVLCGLSSVGFRVVEELIGMRRRVVVIEQDPSNRFVVTARRLGVAVVIGDPGVAEVLRQARAGTARAVVATTDNDMTNLEVALLARELNPRERIVLILNDPQFARMLREAADIQYALSVPALAAPAFVAGLFGHGVAGVFYLGDRLHAVIDLVISENDPYANHAVRAMAHDYRLQPLAVLRPDGTAPAPVATARLGAGDRLMAVVALADLERLFRRQPCPAAFAVEVTAVPLPTRAWLAGLARTLGKAVGDGTDGRPEPLPFLLADGLTRGQAEDLLAQLERERVSGRIRGLDVGGWGGSSD